VTSAIGVDRFLNKLNGDTPGDGSVQSHFIQSVTYKIKMESEPRSGNIVVMLPTYVSLALGSAVIRSVLGGIPMEGNEADVIWNAIGITPKTLEDGGSTKISSVGGIFERIRHLQPPEEDEDGSDDGSDDGDGRDDGSDDGDGGDEE
jgi:hypothetical protein